jgi:hypothetical protein
MIHLNGEKLLGPPSAGVDGGATYFSFRTPLKGFPSAFWSTNRPVSVFRFVQWSFIGFFTCDRSRTAPMR